MSDENRPNRKRRDTWRLRPGDLPPQKILDSEARLKDIEHNAAFRILTFDRRKYTWWSAHSLFRSVPFVMLLSSIAFMLATLFFSARWAPAILNVIFIHWWANLVLPNIAAMYGVKIREPIPSEHVRNLASVGYSGTDLATGLWASRIARTDFRLRAGFLGGAVAALLIALPFWDYALLVAIPGGNPTRFSYGLATFLAAFFLVSTRFAHGGELMFLVWRIKQWLQFRNTSVVGPANPVVMKCADIMMRYHTHGESTRGFLYLLILLAVIITAIALTIVAEGRAGPISAGLTGSLAGLLIGSFAEQHIENNFNRLRDLCGVLLEMEGTEQEKASL